MAGTTSERKDSTTTGRGIVKASWKGYVNWSLDRVDKRMFKEWADDRDIFENEVPSIIDSGYKLSLSYDAYNSACVASLYCHDAGSPNGGWCLTARAAVPYDAMLRVLFIHYVCFEGVWPDDPGDADDSWQ